MAMAEGIDDGLAVFDVPRAAVEPLLRSLRMVNTAADAVFYDVGVLWRQLFARGIRVSTAINAAAPAGRAQFAAFQKMAAHVVNLSAVTDPEGVILVVDAQHAPFIERYADVRKFLKNGLEFAGVGEGGPSAPAPSKVRTVSVTGVGSSALGSAAFAWNVSEALGEPVAAIVPGYGLADIIPQALSGFYGYGLTDYIRELGENTLALMAPQMAAIGRRLSRSIPEPAATVAGEGPAFRRGSPEADILHAILEHAPQITRLYGHSKGALCIGDAISGLDPDRAKALEVTTFSAVIQEQGAAHFEQILGRIDSLGQLNSWGNLPERWIEAWHSTNTMLPLTVPVSKLTTEGLRSVPQAAPTPAAGDTVQ
jgi:hypothetical protein